MLNKIIPFVLVFSLLGFLGYELFHAKPNELPSAMIGEPLPTFALGTISTAGLFTERQLQGRVSLLVVWATWCPACAAEHDMLMKIKQQYRIPIYSLLYKDTPSNAVDWLNEHGNPFVITGNDAKGDIAIDLGVYGTPETYVISPTGRILYRHVGAIDQATWDNVLAPLIKQYQR